MAKTNMPEYGGDQLGMLEAAWFADVSYKERALKKDAAPPQSLKLVGVGLPSRWASEGQGAPAPGFDSKGFHRSGDSSMRLLETLDSKGRKTLVVSFSGSDDLKDFLQDANMGAGTKNSWAAKATREGMERSGQVLASTFPAASIASRLGAEKVGHLMGGAAAGTALAFKAGMSTYVNALGNGGGSIAAATSGARLRGESQAWAATKELGSSVAIGVAGLAGAALSPVLGAVASVAIVGPGEKGAGGPDRAYEVLAEGRKEAVRLALASSQEYDRIVVAGHSLGGNLASQFANELADAAKAQGPGKARMLEKVELQTVNSLWMQKNPPEELGSITHFRRPNDLTDLVGPLGGLEPPKKEHVVLFSDSPTVRGGFNVFDATQIGARHSNSVALKQADAATDATITNIFAKAGETLDRMNPIKSAKADGGELMAALLASGAEAPPKSAVPIRTQIERRLDNPFTKMNQDEDGRLKLASPEELKGRLSAFKKLKAQSENPTSCDKDWVDPETGRRWGDEGMTRTAKPR